jgi:hypothetical protein
MRKDLYIILSLKHSEGITHCFWRPNDAGYTILPWAAGIYTKEDIDQNPKYYNDGYNTLAKPLNNDGLESIGFRCQMDLEKVEDLSKKALKEREKEVSNA